MLLRLDRDIILVNRYTSGVDVIKLLESLEIL